MASHYKQSMVYKNERLVPGRYILMIVPDWNKFAIRHSDFRNIRVGIHSPIEVKLHKLNYQ